MYDIYNDRIREIQRCDMEKPCNFGAQSLNPRLSQRFILRIIRNE